MSQTQCTFVFHHPIRDIELFRQMADVAARLKPYGRVEMDISTLAGKGFHDVPARGSPWHEYASCGPAIEKFFPDPKIAPFIPAEFVLRNRELLTAKVDVLRQMEMGAYFWGLEPYFLPEGYFDAYPQLRGPRVDHPRRSNQSEFAPCVDLPQTQEMFSNMTEQLFRQAPMVGTFAFLTNDSGSGVCWSDWQYSGPNGPVACRNRPMAERMDDLIGAYDRGARKAGGQCDFFVEGHLFSNAESAAMHKRAGGRWFVSTQANPAIRIGSLSWELNPVRGVFDPLAILRSLQAWGQAGIHKVFIRFRPIYDRDHELLSTCQKVVEVVEAFVRDPVYGTMPVLERLRKHCQDWGGPKHGDTLFDATLSLNETLRLATTVVPPYSNIYAGVSMRYITRPLVALPERLTPEEEDYFLPHIFNVSRLQARMDYVDYHGARMVLGRPGMSTDDPRNGALHQWRSRLEGIAQTLSGLEGAPQQEYFHKMSLALRIYASIVRSIGNFYAVQVVRDRNQARFDAGPKGPPKVSYWRGEDDLQTLIEMMRDEMDNTTDLIGILQQDGLDMICRAKTAQDEDTFILGPNLLEQLDLKRKIMRRHWTDAQEYMVSPLK